MEHGHGKSAAWASKPVTLERAGSHLVIKVRILLEHTALGQSTLNLRAAETSRSGWMSSSAAALHAVWSCTTLLTSPAGAGSPKPEYGILPLPSSKVCTVTQFKSMLNLMMCDRWAASNASARPAMCITLTIVSLVVWSVLALCRVYNGMCFDLRSFCPQLTARAKDSFAGPTMPAHTEDTIASGRVLAESPRASNGVQTAVLVDSHGRAAGEVTGHALYASSCRSMLCGSCSVVGSLK